MELNAVGQKLPRIDADAKATGRAIYGFRVPERLYADPFHRP